jgi:hypothetical protein
MTARDGHVHLAMAKPQPRPAWDWARWPTLLLGLGGAGLFVAAFFQEWWRFWLYAPQYPGGLRLNIALTGMSGDVHEIDLLNHYIGMQHLEDAAPVERRLAVYGVAAIAAVTVALVVASGRRLNKIVAVPGFAFPLAFLADSFGWLYRFGHALSPRAPLKIAAFTPQMFGNGKIGQFETYAQPALGFWLAVLGVVCIAAAALFRARVCANCSSRGSCGASCPRYLVLPEPKRAEA